MMEARSVDWVALLKQYESQHAIRGEIDADHEVNRRLRQIFLQRRQQAREREPSLRSVPRFFPRRAHTTAQPQQQSPLSPQQAEPAADQGPSAARALIGKRARNRFLQRRNAAMLTEEELRRIYEMLEDHSSGPYEDEQQISGRVNYDGFCDVRAKLPERAARFFDADTFLKLRRDPWGRVSTHLLFQYICRRVSLYQTRIQLSVYDTVGDGYLREQDLENFIYELIPSLDALGDLQENFYPFYVFTAVRKFFFFLDPRHTCRVAIKDLVSSPILHELLHLQNYNVDPELKVEADASNWFSAHNTLRVYSQYLELDIDHNGMLSRSEIAGYGTGSITSCLIDRVFEECLTYDGEMDYKTFLDFALAMETKKSPQSLAYFFRLLDINKCGFLDRFTINYFFREIVQKLRELDVGMHGDIVRVEDVTDEIFDMCRPRDPAKITLDDLVRCGVGDTIVTMLTDLSGFWAYDNREHLIAEEAREERELEPQQGQVSPAAI